MFLLGLGVVALIAACSDGGDNATNAAAPRVPPGNNAPAAATPLSATDLLAAVVTGDGPLLDGVLEAAWDAAKPLTATATGGKRKSVPVTLRALVSADTLYLAATWPDATESVDDGTWTKTGDGWTRTSGEEDRLGLLWERFPIRGWQGQGCSEGVTCHDEEEEMHLTRPGDLADMWHWKAARTNPAGLADDKRLVYMKPKKNGRKPDRASDGESAKGCYRKNSTANDDAPEYAPAPGGVPFRVDTATKLDAEALAALPVGTVLPGWIMRDPDPNRGDVRARGVHARGQWTLELARRLDTGHPDDDVIFARGKRFRFGLAVFDDAGDEDHDTISQLRLVLPR